jgi:hypothetical protein
MTNSKRDCRQLRFHTARDEPRGALLQTLFAYPLRPAEALARLFDRSDTILARWDAMTVRRRVVGLAAGDAHARIGIRSGEPTDNSLALPLPNAPGALFKALSVFALRDIDLTKLESRPIRGRPWEYLFYVDLGLGRSDVRCSRAVVHLAESARWVKTLGSYARWNEAAMRPIVPEASVDVSAV